MTKKLMLLSLLGMLPSVSQAASQTLTCSFTRSDSSDRVEIVFQDSQNGSFRYQTSPDSSTDTQASLKLKRISGEDETLAYFQVQSSAVQMTFKIDPAFLFKAGNDFPASLWTRIPEMDLSEEQELTCDSILK